MEALRLLRDEPKKAPDPRRHLVSLFNKEYLRKTGRENPLPFGACMRAMQGVFKFVDEETGEITFEYPTEEAWLDQLAGYRVDRFSQENKIVDLPYFLKQFGRFKVPMIKQQQKQVGMRCGDCQKEFRGLEEYNNHVCG